MLGLTKGMSKRKCIAIALIVFFLIAIYLYSNYMHGDIKVDDNVINQSDMVLISENYDILVLNQIYRITAETDDYIELVYCGREYDQEEKSDEWGINSKIYIYKNVKDVEFDKHGEYYRAGLLSQLYGLNRLSYCTSIFSVTYGNCYLSIKEWDSDAKGTVFNNIIAEIKECIAMEKSPI